MKLLVLFLAFAALGAFGQGGFSIPRPSIEFGIYETFGGNITLQCSNVAVLKNPRVNLTIPNYLQRANVTAVAEDPVKFILQLPANLQGELGQLANSLGVDPISFIRNVTSAAADCRLSFGNGQ